MPSKHVIRIRAGSKEVGAWKSYAINIDMLKPADDFSLTLGPLSLEAAELVKPDTLISIIIDGITVITGYVDSQEQGGDKTGTTLQVSGRDKIGRLVDESMPLTEKLRNYNLKSLAERVMDIWFPQVALSNVRNRRLVRGGPSRGLAGSGPEPIFNTQKQVPKKVRPGEKRWDVLAEFLDKADILAWSSGDGRELVLAKPNYNQEPQFRFVVPSAGSQTQRRGNVIKWKIVDNVQDQASAVLVLGAGRGNASTYGRSVTKFTGLALEGPGLDGIGGAFQHRKALIVATSELQDAADAQKQADRELHKRQADAQIIELVVFGHSQKLRPTDVGALFAIDTMVDLTIEPALIFGRYMITSIAFSTDKRAGQVTRLRLVPTGTSLAM